MQSSTKRIGDPNNGHLNYGLVLVQHLNGQNYGLLVRNFNTELV